MMKESITRAFLAVVVILILVLHGGPEVAGGERAAHTSAPLRVMTFNLRYASATPPNAWSQRRPVMRECIRKLAPDVIGTQEGLYSQLKDLAADLRRYGWIGTGRDGGSRGEFMAIFYRQERFEPMEYDHFWLSDTPNVIGSSTWGNSNRRMVTWVRFLDRGAGREFYFFNTHLDHQVQLAREKSAALIRQRVADLPLRLPVILVGDFNARAGDNRAYDILTGDQFLMDAWLMGKVRRNEGISTFHNFEGPKPGGIRIDWILMSCGFDVEASEIVTYSRHGQFPSDHFPVVAWLRWDEAVP
jgi:endonuclease/exonuclease/phosphatase family metal-dependent hydrolase